MAGQAGQSPAGRGYSIAGINEFDELIDDIYHFSESQGLEIETLIHEEGAAQLEINLHHGDPVALADQVFLFKRTIREVALKHDIYATFMAKPMQGQPGSAMHIHQSVLDIETGKNIFLNDDGEQSEAFMAFLGGMQHYLPKSLIMMAPYVNSYRRLAIGTSAPVNVMWGHDNRTTGLRIPLSDAAARRVENRIPSSDANPIWRWQHRFPAGCLVSSNRSCQVRLHQIPPMKGLTSYRAGCWKPWRFLNTTKGCRVCWVKSFAVSLRLSSMVSLKPSCSDQPVGT